MAEKLFKLRSDAFIAIKFGTADKLCRFKFVDSLRNAGMINYFNLCADKPVEIRLCNHQLKKQNE